MYTRWQKLGMVSLVGAWALLGGATPAGAGEALAIRAGEAHIRTVGGLHDGAWNLWSDGEWGDYVQVASGAVYRCRVTCYGSPARGNWPEMAFTVDGQAQALVTVATNRSAEYGFTLRVAAPVCRLAVAFLNDDQTKTEDRNLYVVSLSIEPLGDAATPVLADEATWRAGWSETERRQEQTALAQAAEAITSNRMGAATLRVTGADGRPLAQTALTVEQTGHDFLFGGNIFMFDHFATAREDDLYRERFRALFNYATTGFYWRGYEKRRGRPDYDYTDAVVDWCLRQHIQVKGHPLLWACESGTPTWSDGLPAADVQQRRVTEIMRRYAGKITRWEVVNEPAHLPELAIDAPYRWARAADPAAQLVVNDSAVLGDGCPAFFRLLQQAVSNNVPFDGIGIQAHEPRGKRFPLEQVRRYLDEYATLGKPLHITEFTPTSGGEAITGSHVVGAWDEAAQADYAVKFYTVCFAHPAVAAITWWDLCDDGAWLEGGGLLRKDLSPKPAYLALQRLIRGQWTTRATGQTDLQGRLAFRGFLGDYVVRITRDGQTIERTFHLARAAAGVIEISLRAPPAEKGHP